MSLGASYQRGAHRRPRLLVVADDAPLYSKITALVQQELPHLDVDRVVNAADGLELLCTELPAALVIDLQMPTTDGLQLLAELVGRRVPLPTVVLLQSGAGPSATEPADGLYRLEDPVTAERVAGVVLQALRRPRTGARPLSVGQFLELVPLVKRSCQVQLTSRRGRGRIVFEGGLPVHASAGASRGEAALRELLDWPEAVLDVHELPVPAPRTITEPIPELWVAGEPPALESTEALASELALEDLSDRPGLAAASLKEVPSMANVNLTLERLQDINGAIGAALVDFESGFCLGRVGGGERFNLDVAAAGNTEVVRAKIRVMRDLGLDDEIEDILITLGRQYHLIRPLRSHRQLFLYLAIDREKGNLAMARHQLGAAEKGLEV